MVIPEPFLHEIDMRKSNFRFEHTKNKMPTAVRFETARDIIICTLIAAHPWVFAARLYSEIARVLGL